jgi:hypothetical protein
LPDQTDVLNFAFITPPPPMAMTMMAAAATATVTMTTTISEQITKQAMTIILCYLYFA